MLHSRDDALAFARDITISSISLVQATYRRIRLAQTLAGYSNLLPFGESGETEELDSMKVWSKKEVLDMIVKETKELMEEFKEPGWTNAGETTEAFIDVQESLLVDNP